jgi:hypothetical protein
MKSVVDNLSFIPTPATRALASPASEPSGGCLLASGRFDPCFPDFDSREGALPK